jgi:hypothetical protein
MASRVFRLTTFFQDRLAATSPPKLFGDVLELHQRVVRSSIERRRF